MQYSPPPYDVFIFVIFVDFFHSVYFLFHYIFTKTLIFLINGSFIIIRFKPKC